MRTLLMALLVAAATTSSTEAAVRPSAVVAGGHPSKNYLGPIPQQKLKSATTKRQPKENPALLFGKGR